METKLAALHFLNEKLEEFLSTVDSAHSSEALCNKIIRLLTQALSHSADITIGGSADQQSESIEPTCQTNLKRLHGILSRVAVHLMREKALLESEREAKLKAVLGAGTD